MLFGRRPGSSGTPVHQDVRDALIVPAADEGVMWTEGALDRLAEITMGYPYFLQEFGKPGVGRLGRTRHHQLGRRRTEHPGGDSRTRRRLLPRPDRQDRQSGTAYLRAMGELGPGPKRSSEVAALLGKKTTALGPTRDGLVKKALCYSPRWGEIDFTVPMFDAFMRRRIPDLDSVRARA
jgi:hypothetical protein